MTSKNQHEFVAKHKCPIIYTFQGHKEMLSFQVKFWTDRWTNRLTGRQTTLQQYASVKILQNK